MMLPLLVRLVCRQRVLLLLVRLVCRQRVLLLLVRLVCRQRVLVLRQVLLRVSRWPLVLRARPWLLLRQRVRPMRLLQL